MELIIIGCVVIAFIFKYSGRNPSEFDCIQTLKEYIKKNPECKTDRGIKCKHCNSLYLRHFSYSKYHKALRVFKCNHCLAILYRNEGNTSKYKKRELQKEWLQIKKPSPYTLHKPVNH